MKRFLPLAALACVALAATVATADKKDDNEALVRRYVDLWNSGDLSGADEILAWTVTRTGPTSDTTTQGLDNLRAHIAQTREAYSKFKVSVKDIDADGDRVVLNWTVKGTHSGKGLPEAEGRKVSITGTSVYKVDGGKIAEERASWDYLGVYEQLGVEPPMDRKDQNIAAAKALLTEVYERGNMDLVYELIADEHTFDVPAGEATARGPYAVQKRARMFRSAFPDLEFKIDEIVAEGDLVAAHWTFYGTHGGEFLGVAPTDKKVAISGVSLSRFKDGKAIKTWGVWDTGDFFEQTGVADR